MAGAEEIFFRGSSDELAGGARVEKLVLHQAERLCDAYSLGSFMQASHP